MILLSALQRWVLYPRFMLDVVPLAGEDVPGLERWTIESDEGRVEAWFLLGDGASAEHPAPAVLFAHGNGELIDHWPHALAGYRRLGLSVLLPEYRGYGRCAGSPSQAKIAADFVQFHGLLVARPEVDATRLLYHGRSLGGGAVCALAARRPPHALLLMSTFTGIKPLARRFLLPGSWVVDPFDNLSVVSAFEGPVLVLHGEADRLIPIEHGEALARAAKHGQLRRYPGEPHNVWPSTFFEDVRPFLAESDLLPRDATSATNAAKGVGT